MQRSFVLAVLAFIFGIVLDGMVKTDYFALIVVILSAGVLGVCLMVKRARCFCIGLMLFSLFLGVCTSWLHTMYMPQTTNLQPLEGEFIGTIIDEPVLAKGRINFLLRLEHCGPHDSVYKGQKAKVFVAADHLRGDLHYGKRVKIKGIIALPRQATNAGQFDYRRYLFQQGIYFVVTVDGIADIKLIGTGDYNVIKKLAINSRTALENVYAQILPADISMLMQGMVLGTRTNLAEEVINDFQRTGVFHLLAISGFNIGIIIILCFFVLSLCRVKPKLKASITICIVLFYVLITGAAPSAVRAGIMGVIYLLAIVLDRENDVFSSLACAALLMLIYNPFYIYDVGFQLSFAATLGIVLWTSRLKQCFNRLPTWLANLLAVSCAAYLATLPIIIYHFYKVSLVGLVANILIVPLASVVVWLGTGIALIGLVALPLAKLAVPVAWVTVKIMLNLASIFAKLPFAEIIVPSPSILEIVCYYLLLGLIFLPPENKVKKSIFSLRKEKLLFAGLAVCIMVLATGFYYSLNRQLTVTFLDVGQGDAIFIQTPDRLNILIDGGTAYANDDYQYDAGETVVVHIWPNKGLLSWITCCLHIHIWIISAVCLQ